MNNTEVAYDILNSYNKKRNFFEKDRNRFIENAKMYWGVDYGQYPSYVAQTLLDEGRQAPTFNIIAQKLDGLKGGLLRNQFDMKYLPMSGDIDENALILQDMWYSDKDLMNWDAAYSEFLRDFLIQYGCERMVISDKITPLGNIAFVVENPMTIFPDPLWKTSDSADLTNIDKIAFYTPQELRELYPGKTAEIDGEKARDYIQHVYDDQISSIEDEVPAYAELDNKWNKQHMVIEHHELRTEKDLWEYNVRDGMIPFPATGFDNGSENDILVKKQYAEDNGLKGNDIRFLPRNRKVYWITTVCPSLSMNLILEDRKSEIQIGRLPFFLAGPGRYGSQWRGLVDQLKDVQLNTNKNIMMMSDILEKSARDSFFIDPDMFENDADRMREAEAKWNKSGARIWTAAGASNGGLERYIKQTPSSHIPNDLTSFNSLMGMYADQLSNQIPAAEGRTESSKESGKLFQSKYEANLIARGGLDKELEKHQKAKAEAYLKQAQITYAGIQREFSKVDGNGSFKINEVILSENGELRKRRDIASLPRHRVIITPSKHGIDVRVNNRTMYAELKQYTQDPLMQAMYDTEIVSTMEMTDAKKEEFNMALSLIKEHAALAKVLEIQGLKMQIQQMGGQMGQGGALAPPQLPPGKTVSAMPVSNEQIEEGTPMKGDLKRIEQKVAA